MSPAARKLIAVVPVALVTAALAAPPTASAQAVSCATPVTACVEETFDAAFRTAEASVQTVFDLLTDLQCAGSCVQAACEYVLGPDCPRTAAATRT